MLWFNNKKSMAASEGFCLASTLQSDPNMQECFFSVLTVTQDFPKILFRLLIPDCAKLLWKPVVLHQCHLTARQAEVGP